MPSRLADTTSRPTVSIASRLTTLAGVGMMVLAGGALSGCQTTINGQTLPSAYYLQDDVQYFPAGPEFLLPNKRRAMEEYRAQQAGFAADLEQTF